MPRDSAAGPIGFENDVERADHDHGLAQQEHHGGGEVAAASGGRPPPTEADTNNISLFTSPFYLGDRGSGDWHFIQCSVRSSIL